MSAIFQSYERGALKSATYVLFFAVVVEVLVAFVTVSSRM